MIGGLDFFTFKNTSDIEKEILLDQPEIATKKELEKENFEKVASLSVKAMSVVLMQQLVNEIGRENLPAFEKAVELAAKDEAYGYKYDLTHSDEIFDYGVLAELLAMDLIDHKALAWRYFDRALDLLKKKTSLESISWKQTPKYENLSSEEFKKVVKPGQRWLVTSIKNNVYYLDISKIEGNFIYYSHYEYLNDPHDSGGYGVVLFEHFMSATLVKDVVISSLSTVADLYFNELYTVIPKEHDPKMGTFPDDQGFSKKYVFAWSSIRDLIHFSDSKWRKIRFELPEHGKQELLTPLVGGAYALSHINNNWRVTEEKGIALYE
jgi:hypothetical protein